MPTKLRWVAMLSGRLRLARHRLPLARTSSAPAHRWFCRRNTAGDAMTSLARNGGDAGAPFDLSGTVATNATWAEDIFFTEAGVPFDISELNWKLTFRRSGENTGANITLSTAAGTL